MLDGIKRMTKLTTLKLSGSCFNLIDEYDYERIYDENEEEEDGKILNEESMKNRNLIITTGKNVSEILKRLTNLKILKLKCIVFIYSIFIDCGITDNMMIEICKSLNNLYQLEELNLEENKLTEKSMYELGESISKMRELKSLNIRGIYYIHYPPYC